MMTQTVRRESIPRRGGVTSCAVGRVYYCYYRCQSLLVIVGSTLGTMAKTVEWFSAMVAMDTVYLYNI